MMSPLTESEPLKSRKLLEQYSYDTSKYPVYWIGSSFFALCIYSLGFVTVRVLVAILVIFYLHVRWDWISFLLWRSDIYKPKSRLNTSLEPMRTLETRSLVALPQALLGFQSTRFPSSPGEGRLQWIFKVLVLQFRYFSSHSGPVVWNVKSSRPGIHQRIVIRTINYVSYYVMYQFVLLLCQLVLRHWIVEKDRIIKNI